MTEHTHPRSAIVIGAGPIGLEAAHALAASGLDVHVYERGEIGDAILRWGHVTLFSPWSLNVSERGLTVLDDLGIERPDASAFPTGEAYVARYLRPLAEHPRLKGRVHTRTNVHSIGRKGVLKGELIGSARRRDQPFRVIIQRADGEEDAVYADLVIDASGTTATPNALGDAGLPALGEAAAIAAGRVAFGNPDILGREREAWAGKHALVVGTGYSAATSLNALLTLAEQAPNTRVTWIARASDAPYTRVDDDPLPQRDRLATLANAVAAGERGQGVVTFVPNVHIERIALTGDTAAVTISDASGNARTIEGIDRILANTGFRPDPSLYRELQVHQCYASEGPMKLAAALLSAGGGGGDCLAQTSLGPDTLKSPEPDFFILGAKSYGRRSDFLIKLGVAQIDELLTLIAP